MDRGSHLNMLVLATAAEPTNEISAAMQCNYHCYRGTSFVLKTEATFNKFFWAPSLNNCIPVLSVPLTAFAGLKLFRPQFNVTGLSAACVLLLSPAPSLLWYDQFCETLVSLLDLMSLASCNIYAGIHPLGRPLVAKLWVLLAKELWTI